MEISEPEVDKNKVSVLCSPVSVSGLNRRFSAAVCYK